MGRHKPKPTGPTAPPISSPTTPPPVVQGSGDVNQLPPGFDALVARYGAGGAGGSSSYSASYGGGGSGGGYGGGYAAGGDADLNSATRELDPRYQQQLEDLQSEIQGAQGHFANLDPETKALLAQQKQAALTASRDSAKDQSDNLLARAFAGGNQQSTIFGDVASRFVQHQSAVEAGIEGDSAARELGLRQDLTRNDLDARTLRAQIGQGRLSGGLQEQQNLSDQDRANMDRQGRLREARIGAGAQVESASIGAGATVAAAQIGAQSDRFRSLVSLYGDQQRLGEQQREYNADYGLNRDRLVLDRLRSDRDYDIGRRQVAVQRFGIQSENDRFSQDLAFRNERATADDTYRNNSLSEQQREFDWGQYNEDRRYNLDVNALNRGAYQYNQQRNDQRNSMYAGIITAIIGAFSDRRLKEDIAPVQGALAKLLRVDGVTWKWKKQAASYSGGVIAQDFAEVFPEAVKYNEDGIASVDYGFAIALLIEAVKELSAKVAR